MTHKAGEHNHDRDRNRDRDRDRDRGSNARGPGPREGIYLDAALAIVEQQVNERIDVLAQRHRTTSRALIVGLLVTTLGGGVATAAALTISPEPPAAPTMMESSLELHCVDGPSTTAPALFTARFSLRTAAGSSIALAAICAAARSAVVADAAPSLQDASPDDLLAVATDIIATSTAQKSIQWVDVAEASFGSVQPSATAPTSFTTCERSSDGRLVVLMTLPGADANTTTAQTARCLANDGYRLYKETQ